MLYASLAIEVVDASTGELISRSHNPRVALGDLVKFSEEDMLKVKNVGEKALGEIKDMLAREELGFGMAFEEIDGELVVTNPGSAAVHAGDPVESESK